MAFQPVPPQADLQASIPAGRMAVALKPFAQPTPAFGPGSLEYTRQKAEELQLLQKEGDVSKSTAPHTISSGSNGGGNYSSGRQYF